MRLVADFCSFKLSSAFSDVLIDTTDSSMSHGFLSLISSQFFSLYEVFKVQYTGKHISFPVNGDGEIRTLDPLLARQVLSQLSYTPMVIS